MSTFFEWNMEYGTSPCWHFRPSTRPGSLLGGVGLQTGPLQSPFGFKACGRGSSGSLSPAPGSTAPQKTFGTLPGPPASRSLLPGAWITDWEVSPSPRAQSRFGSPQVRSSLKHSQNEFALLDGAAANQAKWLISIPFSSSLPQPALSVLLYPNALFRSNNTSSRMM